MAPFSPRIPPELVQVIDEIDDGSCGAAELWRELGRIARRRGLLQPSYESVRRLVNERRRPLPLDHSRLRRAAVLAAELMWRARSPKEIAIDFATGRDLATRPERYRGS